MNASMQGGPAAGPPRPIPIAIIGADGFIGRHIVETLSHDRAWQVRAIARAPLREPTPGATSDRRLADARDRAALQAALEGIEIVVHAVAGDPRTIRRTVLPVYRAAEHARCRRIVYLGTAVVHGQAPVEHTREDTPLPRDQRLPYNEAKRWAERKFLALARSGSVEVAVLRPGIVYGPRSRWITDAADALLAGRAGLVDGGAGLCNAIHVANVVHAVRLAARVPAAAGEAFLLGEAEAITWHEFYRRIANSLGIGVETIRVLRFQQQRPRLADRFGLRDLRDRASALARRLSARRPTVQAASDPAAGSAPDLETALLHRALYLPDWSKARALLGYRPIVSPGEAWRDTIDWLASAGYPVVPRPEGGQDDHAAPPAPATPHRQPGTR